MTAPIGERVRALEVAVGHSSSEIKSGLIHDVQELRDEVKALREFQIGLLAAGTVIGALAGVLITLLSPHMSVIFKS